MIIDTHLHHYERGFFSPRWLDYVAYSWAFRNPPFNKDPAIVRPKIEEGLEDVGGNRLIEHMDEAGIDVGVIMPLDWEIGFKDKAGVTIEKMHEIYAGLAKNYKGRLIAFAGIDPQRENAVDIFDWSINKLGMKGLKLYPPTGFYPFDKRVYPLYERCEAMGLPVLIHTGGPGIALLPSRFANPIYLQDVQADFPKLNIWIGHAGHKLYREEAIEVAAVAVNTYLELSFWQEVAYEDEELFIRWLDYARRKVGVHRIIWGSDHFAGKRVRGRESLLKWVQWFHELPETAKKYGIKFSPEEMEMIFGGNAARCLGIK